MTTILHRYRPRGAARALMTCRASELLIAGPAGTGKSMACLEKLLFVALKYAGMRGAVIRKTAVSLTSSALKTWREQVAREAIATGQCWFYGGSQEKPAGYQFANGSFVAVGGMDKATKIMSTDYDMIFVQEATELTIVDWEHILTRLRNGAMPYQQLLADCNPDRDTHFLKQRSDHGTTVMLISTHGDNPMLFAEDGTLTERGAAYMAILDSLTGVRRLRLRDGLWVGAEGIIYDEWNPAVNLIDKFTPPDHWPRYWAVDFGFTHPFVLQCWAEDPDGRAHLYREIYRTGRTPREHGERLLTALTIDGSTDPSVRWREPKPEKVLADHDAAGRAELQATLGIPFEPANKTIAVRDGIDAVKRRIAPAGDGRPRLFIMRDCPMERDPERRAKMLPTSTLDELTAYIWDANKDAPVKEYDDGMDAMRYYVVDRDLSPNYRIRWL